MTSAISCGPAPSWACLALGAGPQDVADCDVQSAALKQDVTCFSKQDIASLIHEVSTQIPYSRHSMLQAFESQGWRKQRSSRHGTAPAHVSMI